MAWPIYAAILAGSAITGGLQYLSGREQQSGIDKATAAQLKLSQQQLDVLKQQYDQLREDIAPFRETGLEANALLNRYLAGDTTAFQESPGYQYQLSEGIKAVGRQASAQGRLGTGAQDKNLLRTAQGLASQDFQNWINNMLTISGRGQQAAQYGGSAGLQYAGNASNVYGNMGDIQGNNALLSGQIRGGTYANLGNILTNAINQGAFQYGYNRPPPPAGGVMPNPYSPKPMPSNALLY